MSDYKGKMPTRSEGVYQVGTNEEPNSAAIVASERNAAIGVDTLNQRPTAKAGDENKIALDVSMSDGDGNSINKNNPMPTYITDSPADEVEDYDLEVDAAKDTPVNHDYITNSELRGLSAYGNSAGLAVFTLQVETGVGTGLYTTVMRKHNSVANPYVELGAKFPKPVAAGITIRVIKENLDNQATDLDSAIFGKEVV